MSELQSLVDDLADELGRSVVVNDPVVRLLATSRHFGDEDEVRVRAVLQRDAGPEVGRHVLDQGVARWTRAGTVPAAPHLGLRARLCVPLRAGADLLGLLMVIDADASLTAAEVARIEAVAAAAAARLDRARDDGARAARDRAVARLLGADPAGRRDAHAAAGWGPGTPVAVTVLDAGDAPGAERALRAVLDPAADRHRGLSTVDGGRGVLVQAVTHRDPHGLRARAERMVAAADRLATGPPGPGTVAGIGAVGVGPDAAWRSAAQARTAARGARLVAGLGPVAAWDALGPWAVLLRLPDDALDPDLVPDPLRRLLRDHRADRLVATLRAWLEHGGSVPRTAAALHLHRTSLHYRLDQIAAVTGLDLDDGRDRLLLHLGLHVVDLLGAAVSDETRTAGDELSAGRP